jgi:hypothetical protein
LIHFSEDSRGEEKRSFSRRSWSGGPDMSFTSRQE